MQIKLLDYIQTPEDQKCLGVATISMDEKIILRYKVIPKKDGKGFFVAAPSCKVGEEYQSAFMLANRIEEEEINSMIRKSVNMHKSVPSLSATSIPLTYPTQEEQLPF